MACEQFLGKNVQDIKNVVLQTLEGHLRSILGEALPTPGTPLLSSRSLTVPPGQGHGMGWGRAGGLSVPLRFLAEKLKHFPSSIFFENFR